MKLYKVKMPFTDRDDARVCWAGSKAEIAAARKELSAITGNGPRSATVEEVNIGTSKPGMLASLNAHATRG